MRPAATSRARRRSTPPLAFWGARASAAILQLWWVTNHAVYHGTWHHNCKIGDAGAPRRCDKSSGLWSANRDSGASSSEQMSRLILTVISKCCLHTGSAARSRPRRRPETEHRPEAPRTSRSRGSSVAATTKNHLHLLTARLADPTKEDGTAPAEGRSRLSRISTPLSRITRTNFLNNEVISHHKIHPARARSLRRHDRRCWGPARAHLLTSALANSRRYLWLAAGLPGCGRLLGCT
jgi:hypothetical protein